MAISFVQETSNIYDGTNTTSFSVAITNLPTVGNTLVMSLRNLGGNNTVTITDPRSNTWTQATRATSSVQDLGIYYTNVANAYSSGDSLTITFSTSSPTKNAIIQEFSGVLSASPVDRNVNTTGTAASRINVFGSAVQQFYELVVTSIGLNAAQASSPTNATSPFNGRVSTNSGNYAIATSYNITATTKTTNTNTWSWGASTGYGGAMVSFYQAPVTNTATQTSISRIIKTQTATQPSISKIATAPTNTIKLIQSSSSTTGSSSTISVTIPNNTVVGNTIILHTSNAFGVQVNSVTDSKSNTYSLDAVSAGSGGTVCIASATIVNQLLAGDTITATYKSGTYSAQSMQAFEFAGIQTSRVDATTTSLFSAVTTITSSATGTLSTTGELAFTATGMNSTAAKQAIQNSGYSSLYPSSSSITASSAAYSILNTTSSQTVTWNFSSSSSGSIGLVVYKVVPSNSNLTLLGVG